MLLVTRCRISAASSGSLPPGIWRHPTSSAVGCTRVSRVPPWTSIANVPQGVDVFPFEVRIGRLDLPQPVARSLERIVSLKVIGMCVGGCLLLSSPFLLGRGLYMRFFAVPPSADPEAVLLGILFFWFGVSLICLGLIKAMQQARLLDAIVQEDFPTLPRRPSIARPLATSSRLRPQR